MPSPRKVLIAEFSQFPGAQIPLLSEEECRALGIERPRLPPFESWTPEQQEAGRKLGDMLAQIAVRQAHVFVLHHLELMQSEGYAGSDCEAEAARRALAALRAGKWKPGRDDVNGLQVAMGYALEAMSNDAGATDKTRARRLKRQSKSRNRFRG